MEPKYRIGESIWFNISELTKGMVEQVEESGIITGVASFEGIFDGVHFPTKTHRYEITVPDHGITHHKISENLIYATRQEAMAAQ